MKGNRNRQSTDRSRWERRLIATVLFIVFAIIVGGTFYVVSQFTLFAHTSPVNQTSASMKQSGTTIIKSINRPPLMHTTQAMTTATPWGIAIDSSHEVVWVAEPGVACEPLPTCNTTSAGLLGEYDLSDGKFIQDFREPQGYTNPVFVAVDAQGHVWFTEPNSDAIGELDPQNATWNQWKVQKGSAPFDLTFDASGNLWFTEYEANCIGFFNPHTHTLVENPIPTPDSDPYGITTDPRGNIWFTENNEGAGRIGSLIPTSSGKVRMIEHKVTTAQPHLITADRAGNIWYSEAFSGSVGEYSPASGSSKTYSVSADLCTYCGTHISGIAVDTQGDIWFDDTLSQRIGYMNPKTGLVVDKKLGDENSGAYDGLAVDRYNRAWFTELNNSLVIMWPKETLK
jgi:virginiamycin B lyase